MDLLHLALLASALALSPLLRPPAGPVLFIASFLYYLYNFAVAHPTPWEAATAALANPAGIVYLLALPSAALALTNHRLAARLATAAAAAYLLASAPPLEAGPWLDPRFSSPWVPLYYAALFAGYGLMLSGAVHGRGFYAGWVLASAGLLFGAVWSYYTFGWGGYWAWDPAQTAHLAAWLAATAVLHIKRGRLAAVGAALGASAVELGGFSPLRRLEPGFAVPLFALSMATLAAGLWEARRSASDRVAAVVGYSMLALSLYVYAAVVAPAFAASLGVQVEVPAGDDAYIRVGLVLAAGAVAGMSLFGVYAVGPRFGAFIPYAVALALGAALTAAGLRPAWESAPYTNFFLVAIFASSLAAVYHLAKGKMDRWAKAVHVLSVALLAAVAVSGPFAYNMSYYKLLAAEPGAVVFTLLPWPYPEKVGVVGVSHSLDVEAVEIPPGLYRTAPFNYSAFVERVGGPFSLAGLNYTVVDVGGVKYVVVWGGGEVVGEWGGFPVARVERNGTVVVFPAPLDLVEALSIDPGLVGKVLKCLGNGSRLVPRGAVYWLRVYVDGAAVEVPVRYDLPGDLRGVGGVVVGVGEVYGVVDVNLAAAPPYKLVGDVWWNKATASYAKSLVDMCNVNAAYTAVSLSAGRYLNLTAFVQYLDADDSLWVVAFRPVPLVPAVWALAAGLVAASIVAGRRGR